jgi:hypothetical protein
MKLKEKRIKVVINKESIKKADKKFSDEIKKVDKKFAKIYK